MHVAADRRRRHDSGGRSILSLSRHPPSHTSDPLASPSSSPNGLHAITLKVRAPKSTTVDPTLNEFYDRTAKALDVCNAIRDGIEQIRNWRKLLEIVLCALDINPSTPRDCRSLHVIVMERFPWGGQRDSGNVWASFGWLHNGRGPLVRDIPCQDRGTQVHFAVPRQLEWASPLLTFHEKIMEESKKKERKGTCGLPRKEREAREKVEELRKVSDSRSEGSGPLECQVREVFHRIVRSRTEGSGI
ncbi:hypothetical protein CRG98_022080 [Punica granatum]|uniref:Uncharacterized protein n=1 Tax=Punica granatum TaxID=22663 RepID=A0A2I0JMB8_PUNGR|nr:hypothetical protein CRG98_022080 [Punica granatum]